jgi:hypothetical protein
MEEPVHREKLPPFLLWEKIVESENSRRLIHRIHAPGHGNHLPQGRSLAHFTLSQSIS